MSKENCCELGKTGSNCEKHCTYYRNGHCKHPDASSELPNGLKLCGHMNCG